MKNFKTKPNLVVTSRLPAKTLIAMGYRRTSRAYCLVTRIDRPDWLQFMAAKMNMAVADFMVPGERLSQQWPGHYRAMYSHDNLTVSPSVSYDIPTSNNDPVGYIPLTIDQLQLDLDKESDEPTMLEIISKLTEALSEAADHLDYCGYGDNWEREGAYATKLPDKIVAAIELGNKVINQTAKR